MKREKKGLQRFFPSSTPTPRDLPHPDCFTVAPVTPTLHALPGHLSSTRASQLWRAYRASATVAFPSGARSHPQAATRVTLPKPPPTASFLHIQDPRKSDWPRGLECPCRGSAAQLHCHVFKVQSCSRCHPPFKNRSATPLLVHTLSPPTHMSISL